MMVSCRTTQIGFLITVYIKNGTKTDNCYPNSNLVSINILDWIYTGQLRCQINPVFRPLDTLLKIEHNNSRGFCWIVFIYNGKKQREIIK